MSCLNGFPEILLSFLSGLFAPLGAVCALPLYPGYIAFLASGIDKKDDRSLVRIGIVVVIGSITSMLFIGLVFVHILRYSITFVLSYISPVLFLLLAVISVLMILGIDPWIYFPAFAVPVLHHPYLNAFIFGAFFGVIILPCNPAPLIVLIALSTTTAGFVQNMLNFIVFGFGMGLPLLIISVLSSKRSLGFTGFFAEKKRSIDIIAGALMLAISVYYLYLLFNGLLSGR